MMVQEIEVVETPLPAERVAEIRREISLALSHAHSFDVVHRDIKPQNILLTEDGTVKVTDFGIARAMEASTMSRTGVMGTPFYMSPEQWAGGRMYANRPCRFSRYTRMVVRAARTIC